MLQHNHHHNITFIHHSSNNFLTTSFSSKWGNENSNLYFWPASCIYQLRVTNYTLLVHLTKHVLYHIMHLKKWILLFTYIVRSHHVMCFTMSVFMCYSHVMYKLQPILTTGGSPPIQGLLPIPPSSHPIIIIILKLLSSQISSPQHDCHWF